MKTVLDKVTQIVTAALVREQVELVDLQLKGRSGSQVLKVYIDGEAPVTLDRCTQVSRSLSDELDIADVIPGKYRLEVSSPGVDRPLQTERDFQRNLNKDVEILLDGEEQGSFKGKVVSVGDEGVSVRNGDVTRTIPLSSIKRCNLSLPW